MTAAATYFPVLAFESEITGPGMVKTRFFPLPGRVALFAVLAEITLVIIINLVAGVAIRGNSLVHLVTVTQRTFDVLVRPSEREIGIFGVVERSFSPAGFMMATAAILAEMAKVIIIFLVAAETGGWRFAK